MSARSSSLVTSGCDQVWLPQSHLTGVHQRTKGGRVVLPRAVAAVREERQPDPASAGQRGEGGDDLGARAVVDRQRERAPGPGRRLITPRGGATGHGPTTGSSTGRGERRPAVGRAASGGEQPPAGSFPHRVARAPWPSRGGREAGGEGEQEPTAVHASDGSHDPPARLRTRRATRRSIRRCWTLVRLRNVTAFVTPCAISRRTVDIRLSPLRGEVPATVMYLKAFSDLTLRAEPVYCTRQCAMSQGGARHEQQPAGIHPPGRAELRRDLGRRPLHARQAMTVAAATLVVAGWPDRPPQPRRRRLGLVGRRGVGHRPRARRCRERARRRRSPPSAAPSGASSSIIGGFTAEVPGDRLDALRAVPGVASVTEDAGLALRSTDVDDQAAQAGSLYTLANKVTGASTMWDAGYTGKGVDVARHRLGRRPGRRAQGRQGRLRTGPDPRANGRGRRTSTPTATARTWPASSPGATPRRRTTSAGTRRLRRHGAGLPDRQHQGR